MPTDTEIILSQLAEIKSDISDMKSAQIKNGNRVYRIERTIIGDPDFRTPGMIDRINKQDEILAKHSILHTGYDGYKKWVRGALYIGTVAAAAITYLLNLVLEYLTTTHK